MEPGHTAINKISSPLLPRVVPRKRLFQKLDQRAHYSLTWISGTAGSGKTTLLASYLAEKKIPCLWYNFDERDEDLGAFFYYLGLAGRKAAPRKHPFLPLLTPEYLQNVTAFVRRYFEELCQSLPPPFFLIFDDYQKIPPLAPLHEAFLNGLSVIPPDIHAIVLSRTDPPPIFAGMLAKNRMRIIGGKDLSLNFAESKRVAEFASGKRIPGKLMEKIHGKTQGWAAGLILMAKSLEAGDAVLEEADSFSPGKVFSYFAGELFAGVEKTEKDFLYRTAVLPSMTASMAKALTGRADASNILTLLERNHLFTEKYYLQAPVYQFHPLFRDFLLSKAQEVFTLEEIGQLQQEAAGILAVAGYHEEAVDLFAKAGKEEDLVRLIEQLAPDLIEQGRNRTLERWIRKLPDGTLEKKPWMLYWLGMNRQLFSPSEARDRFETAFHLFETANDKRGVYLAWSGMVVSTLYEWNDFTVLDPWIEWLEKNLLEEATFPTPEIEARVTVNMMAALMFRKPHHSRMDQWAERALSLTRKYGDHHLQIEAADWAITYYCWIGNFRRAEIIKSEAGRLMEAARDYPPGRLHWKWLDIATRIFNEIIDDTTLEEVSTALRNAEERGLRTWEHMFLLDGVFIALMLGDFSRAGAFLNRLEPILNPSRYHGHGVFHHCAALYNWLGKDLKKALEHERIAAQISTETGHVFPTIVCRYGLSQILIEQGELDEAGKELDAVTLQSKETRSTVLEFMCLAGKSWLALKEKREQDALRHLKEAMTLGRKNAFQSMVWWWHPEMMSRLCALALSQGIEVDYCRRLITARDLKLEQPPYELDDWPWALKIHTFSRFEVLINGSPPQFSGKSQKKPFQLLKVLIAHGGTAVDVEKIMDDLWPDAEGDMAHSAFSTNLNRLRKILTKRDAIQLQDGRLTLNPETCWVDTRAFEALIEEANGLWGEDGNKRAVAAYEKAFSLYRGPFLAEEPLQHWMVPLRERLSLRYQRSLINLGKVMEGQDHYEKAIGWYEKGLKADNLEETFYRRLMTCYEKLDRHADAVKIYRRCREAFARFLGVPPSEETEKILKKIVRSMPKSPNEEIPF